jgi:chromosome segregation ATPase
MTPVELTAIVGAVVAVIGSIGIPIWLQKRKDAEDKGLSAVVSWKGITDALQKERDELRRQLDEADERQRRKVKTLEADWQQQIAAAKQRITDLENEVTALRRALRDGESSTS